MDENELKLCYYAEKMMEFGREASVSSAEPFRLAARQFLRHLRRKLGQRGFITSLPEGANLHTFYLWVEFDQRHFWLPPASFAYRPRSHHQDPGGKLRLWPYKDLANNPLAFVDEVEKLSRRYWVYRLVNGTVVPGTCYRHDHVRPEFHDMVVGEVRPLINQLYVKRLSR